MSDPEDTSDEIVLADLADEDFRDGILFVPEVLLGLAPFQADPACDIAGYHLFCFNQVQSTEAWRHQSLEALA